jgi:protein-S-isoprenylcysteine O-methyltransferase
MPPLLLAYALLAAFFGLERLLRRDAAARSLEADAADRGTTRLIGLAYGLAMNAGLLAPLLARLRIGRLPGPSLQRLGLVTMLLGLGLRAWAARSLGRYYTRTLRTTADQPLVRAGPYRVVRHPGYAADMLLWLGFSLAAGNAILLGLIGAMMGVAYARRMAVEEALLAQQLGEPYRTYQRQTWRLVPGVL